MEKDKNTIIAKEANDFETASDSLYSLCLELASVSPLAFAKTIHEIILGTCRYMLFLAHVDKQLPPDVFQDMLATNIHLKELDIRNDFAVFSSEVANDYGIRADTVELGDDECDF